MYVAIAIFGFIVCLLSLALYFFVSYRHPEWLGMSGQKTKSLEDHKQSEEAKSRPKDFFSS